MSLGVAGPALASVSAGHAGTAQPVLFGTLDTQAGTAAQEARAGVPMAMFELNWASFEPQNGVVSSSYLATMKSYLAAYQAAGQKVTLGLGLQNPPSWVFSLANSRYKDQNGNTSSEADFVFSQAVRQAAATYLSLVAANLPLSSFWAIRLRISSIVISLGFSLARKYERRPEPFSKARTLLLTWPLSPSISPQYSPAR